MAGDVDVDQLVVAAEAVNVRYIFGNRQAETVGVVALGGRRLETVRTVVDVTLHWL